MAAEVTEIIRHNFGNSVETAEMWTSMALFYAEDNDLLTKEERKVLKEAKSILTRKREGGG